ncbi:MAG: hypothetical protein JW724_02415 [Candidatus Altiarchaeota archaeon]|nr:hypothetical protein [Candidatus Altiarchaeota archaeon]
MHHIKDLFNGDQDQEYIHRKFVRYSKGVYDGPAISLKKTSNSIKIRGSFDYADALAGTILVNSAGKVRVSGSVFSREPVKSDLAVKTKKKPGAYTTELKGEAEAEELSGLYRENKDATFLIDLESDALKMKTKKKPPKPGAGSDDQFFTASVPASMLGALMEDVCFDCPKNEWKELRIRHTYKIDEIVVPDQYRNDAAKARLHAKRKGSVARRIEADGEAKETVKDLLV